MILKPSSGITSKLSLRNVSSEYIHRKEHTIALSKVSFDVEKGEVVAILGPSGSGKTTLLKVIAGFQDYGGDIKLDGADIENIPIRSRRLAYIPQNKALYPRFTVFDNIAFPLKLAKMPLDEMKKRVNKVAKDFGIELLLSRKPRQLSGGQRQMVALAKAVVNYAELLLLDEPFSELDEENKSKMCLLLKEVSVRYGASIILVTHDYLIAQKASNKIVNLEDGKVVSIRRSTDVLSSL